jgi:hypothetical protein
MGFEIHFPTDSPRVLNKHASNPHRIQPNACNVTLPNGSRDHPWCNRRLPNLTRVFITRLTSRLIWLNNASRYQLESYSNLTYSTVGIFYQDVSLPNSLSGMYRSHVNSPFSTISQSSLNERCFPKAST